MKNHFTICEKSTYLNVWLNRSKSNKTIVIPLKNAISVYYKKVTLEKWSDEAIGYMWCQNNDLQNSNIFSSVWGDGHGFYLNEKNLWQGAVISQLED